MQFIPAFTRVGFEAASPAESRTGFKEFVARWSPVATALLTAAAYYAGCRIGFAFTPHGTPIALFWPPNAILLAVLLLAPIQSWWIYLLAVLPAHLLVQTQAGIGITTAFGWYVSNTSEALIGAAATRYLSGTRRTRFALNDIKDLKVFLLGAVFVAPFLTSFMDAATAVRIGYTRGYWTLWGTRLVSNMIASLIMAPAVLMLWREGFSWLTKATLVRCMELACMLLGTVLVSTYVFAGPVGVLMDFSAIMFAPLPFLLWAALRFGPAGLSSSLLAVALISLGNAIHGLQASDAALVAKNVLTMQVLIAGFGVPLMWLSVLIKERREVEISAGDRRELLMQAENTLREVGRKLHSDITQQLTLLTLDVETLSGEIGPWSPARGQLLTLNEQIARLSTATRDWSHVLDPISIEYLGLPGALAALCRRATEDSRVRFNFSTEGNSERLDSITALSLYRVVQEAVENILKLSSIRTANVRLEISAESALLALEHDGTESDDSSPRETGMVSMRRRVGLLDGKFSTHSSQSGTRIDVAVPLGIV